MSQSLRSFIDGCHKGPAYRTPVKAFLAAFKATLPAAEQRWWNRSRMLVELAAAGIPVGRIAGVSAIGGLLLTPPAGFAVQDGRLVGTA